MKIAEIYSLFQQSNGITTDTRKITDNCLFFALKGDNFNGNTFAEKAIESGASYAIIDEESYDTNSKTILVENVLSTLQQLANYHRKQLKTTILSITGSNGKTTTKELINAVLSVKYNTTATIGNLNNHIGVPLTLLSMSEETQIGIVEMGANHQKEIQLLASIAEPNYGYITNFGKAHLEGFGGIEGVIKGKTELYEYIRSSKGTVFINNNDPIQIEKSDGIKRIEFGSNTRLKATEPFLQIEYKNVEINTNLIGAYNYSNICSSIAIGEYFNVSPQLIKQALESYIPSNNRSQIIEKKGSHIIMDAYNANPTSMKAALDNFEKTIADNKTVILGDMFELGIATDQEHQEIVKYSEDLNFETIHLIGEHFSKTKASKAKLHSTFEAFKNSFKVTKGTYLIKGSRGMSLERTLELFD